MKHSTISRKRKNTTEQNSFSLSLSALQTTSTMSNKNAFRAFILMNLHTASVQRENRTPSFISFYKRNTVPSARRVRVRATNADEDEAEDLRIRNHHRQHPIEHGGADDQKTNEERHDEADPRSVCSRNDADSSRADDIEIDLCPCCLLKMTT